MSIKKIFCLIVVVSGFSINGFSQSETNREIDNDSLPFEFKHTKEKSIGVAIDIIENWRITKRNRNDYFVIQNQDEKSFVKITLKDADVVLDSILNNNAKKNNNCKSDVSSKELISEIVKLDSIVKTKSNSKLNMTLSNSTLSNKNGHITSTTYKTINRRGFLIVAQIEEDCIDCKKEVDFMIESMRNYE